MSWAGIKDFLRRFWLCIDNIKLLDWMHRKNIQLFFFFLLRYRVSPAILTDVLKQDVDTDESGRLFALGTSRLKIGKISKTTGLERTNLADELLLKIARKEDLPDLLEIGVSDGSSSLGLFSLKDVFGRVVLTDRFSRFYERGIPFGKIILDADGRRYGVKFICFFIYLSPILVENIEGYSPIEVVNPILRKRYGIQEITRFNMFEDVLDDPVDIIKCANILNKVYFSDEQLLAAVVNLRLSLNDGGHLVISQNNNSYTDGEAVFVMQKVGSGFQVLESVNEHDIIDLFQETKE